MSWGSLKSNVIWSLLSNIINIGGLASVGQNVQSVIARKPLYVRLVASFSEEVFLVNISYDQPFVCCVYRQCR